VKSKTQQLPESATKLKSFH